MKNKLYHVSCFYFDKGNYRLSSRDILTLLTSLIILNPFKDRIVKVISSFRRMKNNIICEK